MPDQGSVQYCPGDRHSRLLRQLNWIAPECRSSLFAGFLFHFCTMKTYRKAIEEKVRIQAIPCNVLKWLRELLATIQIQTNKKFPIVAKVLFLTLRRYCNMQKLHMLLRILFFRAAAGCGTGETKRRRNVHVRDFNGVYVRISMF